MCSCSCCSPTSTAAGTTSAQPLPTPQLRDAPARAAAAAGPGYVVEGMTCGHCASSVTKAVSALPGVHDVAVDLGSGSLTFASDAPVARETVEAAVRDAGYALA